MISMKSSNERNLRDILSEIKNSPQIKPHLQKLSVEDAWKKLMGISISKHTLKIKLISEKLFISLDSDVLRHELSYAKSKIVTMLNEELKEEVIREIIFN